MRRILITVTTIAITVHGIHAQQREAQNTPSSSYSLPTSKRGPLSKTFTASTASLVVARASSAGMESAIAPDLHCAR
jgi:hypothetical protein